MSDFQLKPEEEQLLDHFAGLAMRAILDGRSLFISEAIASKSYDMAEAMLIERRNRRASHQHIRGLGT